MRFYRIKQIGENEFIPQTRNWYEFSYNGIQSIFGDYDIWFSPKIQTKYCCVATLENAKGVIDDYKKSINAKYQKYPKYHKAK
jgi:hypothetical protein